MILPVLYASRPIQGMMSCRPCRRDIRGRLAGSLLLPPGGFFHGVLVPGCLGVLLTNPFIARFLEPTHQLRPVALDDLAAEEYVDELGLDVIQDSFVVGDDQNTRGVLGGHSVDAFG